MTAAASSACSAATDVKETIMHTEDIHTHDLQAAKLRDNCYAVFLQRENLRQEIGTITHVDPGQWCFHALIDEHEGRFYGHRDITIEADNVGQALSELTKRVGVALRDEHDTFLDDDTMMAFTQLSLQNLTELAGRTGSGYGYTVGIAKALGRYIAEDLPNGMQDYDRFWAMFGNGVRQFAERANSHNKAKARINAVIEGMLGSDKEADEENETAASSKPQ